MHSRKGEHCPRQGQQTPRQVHARPAAHPSTHMIPGPARSLSYGASPPASRGLKSPSSAPSGGSTLQGYRVPQAVRTNARKVASHHVCAGPALDGDETPQERTQPALLSAEDHLHIQQHSIVHQQQASSRPLAATKGSAPAGITQ